MATRFDAIIIGTGQAGPPLAGRLTDAGWHCAIMERQRFGGTCVNCGCTPPRALVASARGAYLARRAADFGVDIEGPIRVDMTKVKQRKDQIAGRSNEKQAIELIGILHKAGADVNVVALINHPQEIRGGTALHYAVRKRQKELIKFLASLQIDLNAVDQDGLTALDYTQSRGFMPFMALQTPVFKEEAQILRDLGATKMMARSPVWPVLGPPQGIWEDIYPLGEARVHDPVYKHSTAASGP